MAPATRPSGGCEKHPFPEQDNGMTDRMDMENISRNAQRIQGRIAEACRRAGRSPDEITLVAVSKTFPVAAVEAARRAGIRHFGENRVQELAQKSTETPGREQGGDITWHMIGHLQRNKARDVVRFADCFHALDSARLARALSERAKTEGRILPCLTQVNISGEGSKFGVPPNEILALFDEVACCEHIRVRGLMAIGSLQAEPDAARREFQRLRSLFDALPARFAPNISMEQLSMGMSRDFEAAIKEGATHVRIGSALFGKRIVRDDDKHAKPA